MDSRTAKKLSQNEQDVAEFAQNIPMLIGFMPYLAKAYMAYYIALIKAGFSSEQAVFIWYVSMALALD